MSYTSTGGLPTIPRLAVAGVDEGAPGSAASSGAGSGSSDPLTLTPRATPAAPASGLKLYADATGKLSWIRASDGFTRTFEVTATANRTFTAPDADFTFAGQNLANTFTLANTFSANGALSAPAVSFTGTPITGGSATTTKPLVLIETSGATSTGWSTSGTMMGVNAPSGFSGTIHEWQVNGSPRARVTSGGSFVTDGGVFLASSAAGGQFQIAADAILSRKAAANWQLGAADAAAPVAQTLSVQSVVAGTSNTAGADWTQRGSLGTGTGASGNIVFQVGTPAASGSTQHTASTGLTLSNVGTSGTAAHRATFAGTVATAGYTVATLPAAGTAGRRAYVTDATAPTYLGALTGGGSVVCPVFDNGTAWVSA